MSVVELMLTAEQLAAAYLQLSTTERHSFLEAVFSNPANYHMALELSTVVHIILQKKFPPDTQRLLDRLLDKNTEGVLQPVEQQQMEVLLAEYGTNLVEKARARYIVELLQRATTNES
jgi:hypothetical protein